MKKNGKKTLVAIFCAILLSSSLISCSQSTDATSKNETANGQPTSQQQSGSMNASQNNQTNSASQQTKPNSSETSQSIEKEKYEAQIAYYMELAESLQAQLVKQKEEAYIDECEYKLKIEALQETVSLLEATVNALSTNNKQPSATPDTPTQNQPEYDKVVLQNAFQYSINNGKVTIIGYTGNDIDVVIPSNINGFPVTDIGEGAFQNSYVRSVTIPSSVRHIDWFAFSGCTALQSITIPSSVLSIDYGAFDYCPKTLTVKCEKGSYAEAYAKSWGMKTEIN